MAEDDFDPKAWLQERQQQKKQAPPETPPDFDPGSWLRERGTPGALSAAPPQVVMGAPDPVGKYRPGFIKGAEQAVVGSGAGLASAAQAVRGVPYAGAAIAQFPLARPLFDIAKSVSPEQREKAEKFANEPYTLPGQMAGYYAGKAAELGLPAGSVSEIRQGIDAAAKIATLEGAWHAAGYLAHSVLPPGFGSTYFIYRLIKHFGVKPLMDFFKEAKNVTQDVKAIREELAGAKGAGKFIPKEAEKEAPKSAPRPAPKEEPREPAKKRTTKLPGTFPWDKGKPPTQ